ncbi:MAG: type II toxin-antitoxin system HicB family antitoxin [Candidatus Xenobiia bacterium LiM19]
MTSYPARYNKIMSGYEAEFIDIPHAYALGKTLRELRKNAGEVLTEVLNDYLLDGEEQTSTLLIA